MSPPAVRVAWSVGDRGLHGTKEGYRPEILTTSARGLEALAPREGAIWTLGADGGLSRSVVQTRPEVYVRMCVALTSGGRALILGRPRSPRPGREWCLQIVDERGAQGAILNSVGTTELVPWSLCELPGDELAVGLAATELPDGGDVPGGLIIWNWRSGAFRWVWRPPSIELKLPSSVRLKPDGAFLIADPHLHQIFELSPEGQVTWSFGVRRIPGSDDRHLRGPEDCWPTDRGVLIADTLNNRVLEVDHTGRILDEIGRRTGLILAEPKSVMAVGEDCLIADSGHGRVVQVDRRRAVRKVWSPDHPSPQALLSLPRSVDLSPAGDLILADCNNHRVIAVSAAGEMVWEIAEAPGLAGSCLHWPRSARLDADGHLWIADSLNYRLLIVDPTRRSCREIHQLKGAAGAIAFGDLHDVRPLENGNVLLVDADGGWVAEVDVEGRIHWDYGLPGGATPAIKLLDPHQAVRAPNGDTIVVDAYTHRVLAISQSGLARELFAQNSASSRLTKPRAIALHPRGLAVADDQSVVRIISWEGAELLAIGPQLIHAGAAKLLGKPRDLLVVSDTEMLISDHDSGRLFSVIIDWAVQERLKRQRLGALISD